MSNIVKYQPAWMARREPARDTKAVAVRKIEQIPAPARPQVFPADRQVGPRLTPTVIMPNDLAAYMSGRPALVRMRG